MKIVSGLIIILSVTQILSAKISNEFILDAGTKQTILLGDSIDLNGKVILGDKDKIDHYQWEENRKVLKNTLGDEIVYWDDANAENEYRPKKVGNHILKYTVVDTRGKKHIKRLLIKVETKVNVRISENDLRFDIRSDFPVKREQRPEGNYRLSRGHYLDVNVGDVIPLSAIVSSSKKYLVDNYRWELKGKILKNQLNDEILYWDEENRENDYVAKKSGKEFLKFIVTDINGRETSKTLLLKISDENIDDHGNDIAFATPIKLNKLINAKLETQNDHDFFKFTIDKKQYIRVIFTQKGPREVVMLNADGQKVALQYIEVPASGGMTNMYQTIFEAGTYYLDVSGKLGKYTLEVKADDIQVDKYGDSKSTATEVKLNSQIVGYVNNSTDKDYFYIVAPKTGRLTVTASKERFLIAVDNENSYKSFNVEKGKKYYFAITGYKSRSTRHLIQRKYKLSLSFK